MFPPKDQGTGKDQKITISGSSSMDEAEVERLKQEAEKFAERRQGKERIDPKFGMNSTQWFIKARSNLPI